MLHEAEMSGLGGWKKPDAPPRMCSSASVSPNRSGGAATVPRSSRPNLARKHSRKVRPRSFSLPAHVAATVSAPHTPATEVDVCASLDACMLRCTSLPSNPVTAHGACNLGLVPAHD